MTPRLIVVALMAALVLAGCGRRGSLDPPPGAENVREVPRAGEFPEPKDGEADEPFVLDFSNTIFPVISFAPFACFVVPRPANVSIDLSTLLVNRSLECSTPTVRDEQHVVFALPLGVA